ncbi:hypothetical protein B0T14DRAFT_239152 [Immersiella caudata]|uniref:Uncharacterized protein n=1 Tax=Immersiella caudata TaxID=314043 RepID=A0AA39WSS2_9PEZI|nr:hypothetical protein B0T14DRAFT_239152 [Immersiella caudata]
MEAWDRLHVERPTMQLCSIACGERPPASSTTYLLRTVSHNGATGHYDQATGHKGRYDPSGWAGTERHARYAIVAIQVALLSAAHWTVRLERTVPTDGHDIAWVSHARFFSLSRFFARGAYAGLLHGVSSSSLFLLVLFDIGRRTALPIAASQMSARGRFANALKLVPCKDGKDFLHFRSTTLLSQMKQVNVQHRFCPAEQPRSGPLPDLRLRCRGRMPTRSKLGCLHLPSGRSGSLWHMIISASLALRIPLALAALQVSLGLPPRKNP